VEPGLAAALIRVAAVAGDDTPCAVVRTPRGWVVATDPVEVVEASGPPAWDALDDLAPGFWAGFATFELGHAVERVEPGRAGFDASRPLPDLAFARFASVEPVDAAPYAARARLAREVVEAAPRLGSAAHTSLTHDEYAARVERVLEHIRAGDCYQVNLTRTLEWHTAPDPIALFGALTVRGPAPHATLLQLPLRDGSAAVVSASPERFLSWHGAEVETRPIKGTAAVADALARSAKDRAENVMIVDLARNDLGRVCRTGSIHVPALCATERHPGLAHLVSTVRGELRDDVGLGRLVRATFPAASITGAPKPRVLQLIEDLEPVRRGVYCGAVGWIDTGRGTGDHEGDLAVAIRTFTVAHGRTTHGVGGGIVADSDPDREWDETCLKARRLLRATGAGEPEPVVTPRDGARVSA
jgi:para-aminobenzoate synthetase component 1